MCYEYANRIPYRRYVEEFSHLKLPLVVEGNGPDLTPRDEIHIRDTAPVILRGRDSVELTERIWAPRAANKKPVFNFRSEKRSFGKSTRCLLPASHFCEFTAPTDSTQKAFFSTYPPCGFVEPIATFHSDPCVNSVVILMRNGT
jgi:putative SOS response-associated peptidase YedK